MQYIGTFSKNVATNVDRDFIETTIVELVKKI